MVILLQLHLVADRWADTNDQPSAIQGFSKSDQTLFPHERCYAPGKDGIIRGVPDPRLLNLNVDSPQTVPHPRLNADSRYCRILPPEFQLVRRPRTPRILPTEPCLVLSFRPARLKQVDE